MFKKMVTNSPRSFMRLWSNIRLSDDYCDVQSQLKRIEAKIRSARNSGVNVELEVGEISFLKEKFPQSVHRLLSRRFSALIYSKSFLLLTKNT